MPESCGANGVADHGTVLVARVPIRSGSISTSAFWPARPRAVRGPRRVIDSMCVKETHPRPPSTALVAKSKVNQALCSVGDRGGHQILAG